MQIKEKMKKRKERGKKKKNNVKLRARKQSCRTMKKVLLLCNKSKGDFEKEAQMKKRKGKKHILVSPILFKLGCINYWS